MEKAKLYIQTVLEIMNLTEKEESNGLVLGQGEKTLLEIALKDIESSQRIIHNKPQHGFYYWIKHYDYSEWEVARYFETNNFFGHFKFIGDNKDTPSYCELGDWDSSPIVHDLG